MAHSPHRLLAPGPFFADQIAEGSPYELSRGHAVLCLPAGSRHGRGNLAGGAVLLSDPAVEEAGVDVGYSPEAQQLRAPDISVGNVPDEPGWVKGVPPLAVEYADRGQDEADLQEKVNELLAAGTRYLWVVRLTGPRRVEVYEAGKPMRRVTAEEELTAPGVLKNPVPVMALYDQKAAEVVMLRNLLERQGVKSLEHVRQKGEQKGKREGKREGLREAVVSLCDVLSIPLSSERQAWLAVATVKELEELTLRLRRQRMW